MRRLRSLALAFAGSAVLAACATPDIRPELVFSQETENEYTTGALDELQSLPPPQGKIAVAVYQFQDQTGQNKPNSRFSEYSRAVTQGATSILINALERAGNRSWFTTVERSSLQALLQERQIIRLTRQEYGGAHLPPLPPLTYAGVMLDGGIIGYDSNTLTGGFGARFLGVGGHTEYRRDTVTVFLRAISVQTGEVLKSINTSKTIYSVGLQGGAFRYIGFRDLLEVETGITTNEPVTLAVKSAIEKAVYSLVMEGLIDGYWRLQDMNMAPALIERYRQQRDGVYNVASLRTTMEEYQNGVRLAPPPSRVPAHDNGSAEAEIAPPLTPGVPEPPPGPTYVLPDGRSPIPSQRDRPPHLVPRS
ncbi:CsgG/HfaB family protein [Telmatospirillum sp. J64-1]|uniref:CsgG/HfaB family protein n=1 Tax=Telmatospirillum sp. J64-1 TaxID=2502183 RepID=UPI00115DB89C|nr:CsgG/HfaB family protein [Telmatospirillum sp. J64-1]